MCTFSWLKRQRILRVLFILQNTSMSTKRYSQSRVCAGSLCCNYHVCSINSLILVPICKDVLNWKVMPRKADLEQRIKRTEGIK